MTDRDVDLDPEERRIKELLLRSARLDVPRSGAKERSVDAGLSALSRSTRDGRLIAAGGVVLALAAGLALWLGTRESAEPAPHVAPEPARAAVSPARSAEPIARPPCPKLVVARGDAPLLEDFESHDSTVLPLDGRGGTWTTYDDGTGKQTPPDRSPLFPARIAGGRGQSQRALHLSGGTFKDWGVTFGAELANAACYDASAYAGLEFWAKGPGAVKVGFQMIDVQDEKYGGFCKTDCYNTQRKVIELESAWKHYEIRWEELRQLYEAGPPLSFDPSRIRFLEFSIAPEHTPFDLWLDDVAFLERER